MSCKPVAFDDKRRATGLEVGTIPGGKPLQYKYPGTIRTAHLDRRTSLCLLIIFDSCTPAILHLSSCVKSLIWYVTRKKWNKQEIFKNNNETANAWQWHIIKITLQHSNYYHLSFDFKNLWWSHAIPPGVPRNVPDGDQPPSRPGACAARSSRLRTKRPPTTSSALRGVIFHTDPARISRCFCEVFQDRCLNFTHHI